MEMEMVMENTRSTTTTKSTAMRLPIGYRFLPTEEEIIIHYLRPKVLSFPLPATTAILHSPHLFLHHPLQLPGNPKEKRYFFCKTNSFHHPYFSNPAGYWKPINNKSHNKLILAPGCNHPIGFKKCFVFYQTTSNHCRSSTRTPWILHQFHLLYPLPIKTEEWTVCSIHMSKKLRKKSHHIHILKEEEQSINDDDDHSSVTMEDHQFDPPPQQASDDWPKLVKF